MNVGDHARLLRRRDKWRIIERRFDVAEAGLRKPNSLVGQLFEVRIGHSWLENEVTSKHPHAAGPVVVPAFLGGDRERLGTLNRVRVPWNVNLARRDHGRSAVSYTHL